jgi:hypothetical protein
MLTLHRNSSGSPLSHGTGLHTLRHNDIVPEYPCLGEVLKLEQFSTERVEIALCSACGTEFQYVPDSTWVTIISRGMRNPI